jgi:hypothetical protein
MSLPGSQRVAGTDGSDFQHRERIATHYHVSLETKSRLRLLIYLHFVLALLVLFQIITYHLPLITTIKTPQPHLWQYIWLLTIIPSICGLISMNKNHIFLMKIFFRGTVTFGLGTIMTTIILNLSDLFTYNKLKANHQLADVEPQIFHGFSLLVLWYIFLIIMVQIHAFSLYMANVLLHSWQQHKSK